MHLTMEDVQASIRPEASFLLARTSRWLADSGITAYLVGGFVRDSFLSRATADIDMAVSANAPEIARDYAEAFGGTYVLLDQANAVARVILPGWQVDFSTIEGDINTDLARRDFTIDTMAIDLANAGTDLKLSRVIDPFRGHDDLQRRLVRMVKPTAFAADPVRLLRAVRLAGELGFQIEAATEDQVRQDALLVAAVPGERAREELMRLLALPGAGRCLRYLDQLGLLTALIPELTHAKGTTQPLLHHWDVFDHSLWTVSAAEFLLRDGPWEHADPSILADVPWSEACRQHFEEPVSAGSTRKSILKVASLLHDIAKPQTKTIDETGRTRFLGHPQEGAEIASGVLGRLRFSAREIKMVETMVKHHLRLNQAGDELPTRRAIYRFFRDTGDAGVDILFLNLADHLAARGPDLDRAEWRRHARVVAYVMEQYFSDKSAARPEKLIDGHDLVKMFALEPGPKVGKVLEAVREAQAEGEIATREQALELARRLVAQDNID